MATTDAYFCRMDRRAKGWAACGGARVLSKPICSDIDVTSVSVLHQEVASTG
jgi:hypothetical protein